MKNRLGTRRGGFRSDNHEVITAGDGRAAKVRHLKVSRSPRRQVIRAGQQKDVAAG